MTAVLLLLCLRITSLRELSCVDVNVGRSGSSDFEAMSTRARAKRSTSKVGSAFLTSYPLEQPDRPPQHSAAPYLPLRPPLHLYRPSLRATHFLLARANSPMLLDGRAPVDLPLGSKDEGTPPPIMRLSAELLLQVFEHLPMMFGRESRRTRSRGL